MQGSNTRIGTLVPDIHRGAFCHRTILKTLALFSRGAGVASPCRFSALITAIRGILT
jgi:hypothetical protein